MISQRAASATFHCHPQPQETSNARIKLFLDFFVLVVITVMYFSTERCCLDPPSKAVFCVASSKLRQIKKPWGSGQAGASARVPITRFGGILVFFSCLKLGSQT